MDYDLNSAHNNEYLRELTNLKHLTIGDSKMKDDILSLIADSCPMLEELCIYNNKDITDEGVAKVTSKCKFLKFVGLNKCSRLTDKSIALIAANCSNLVELSINTNRNITTAAIHFLVSHCRCLGKLSILGLPKIDPYMVDWIHSTFSNIDVDYIYFKEWEKYVERV
jgi:hypothetical protein